jgi:hypothetical protein
LQNVFQQNVFQPNICQPNVRWPNVGRAKWFSTKRHEATSLLWQQVLKSHLSKIEGTSKDRDWSRSIEKAGEALQLLYPDGACTIKLAMAVIYYVAL